MKLQYWLLIILLGAVWGCSFLFNAVLIREISPLWVSAGRVSIGAAICWVVFLATRKKLPTDLSLYPQFLVLGILNYAIPFALFPYAEVTVASSIVGVINGMTPMTTVIVSQLWPGGEKATWNKVIGVLIGFAGALILALPSFSEGASAQVIGLLAALAATCCYALTLNYARRFAKVGRADRYLGVLDELQLPASLLAAAARRRYELVTQHVHHADLGNPARCAGPSRALRARPRSRHRRDLPRPRVHRRPNGQALAQGPRLTGATRTDRLAAANREQVVGVRPQRTVLGVALLTHHVALVASQYEHSVFVLAEVKAHMAAVHAASLPAEHRDIADDRRPRHGSPPAVVVP